MFAVRRSYVADNCLCPFIDVNMLDTDPEEAFLERRFGTDYSSYKASVRRWL